MKIIHFSDTHLGFSDYTRIDSNTGINQREQDFYNTWNEVIDAILANKPDTVIHAGDLFHTTRPTNRAIAVALEGIQKISNAGIPFVLISGNHSTPKIKATGSIFESISLFPNVYTAYQSKYQKFRIGECDVHCVPHCSLTEELEQAFEESLRSQRSTFNSLLSEGVISEETFAVLVNEVDAALVNHDINQGDILLRRTEELPPITKLIVASISEPDVYEALHMLGILGIPTVRLSSTIGPRGRVSLTLLIGVEEELVDKVIETITNCCESPVVQRGGLFGLLVSGQSRSETTPDQAYIYVFDVEHYEEI